MLVRDAWSGAVRDRLEHDDEVRGLPVSLRGDLWVTVAGRRVLARRTDGARTSAAGAPVAIELPFAPDRASVAGNGRRVVAHDATRVAVLDLQGDAWTVVVTHELPDLGIARAAVTHDGRSAVLASARGLHRLALDVPGARPEPLAEGGPANDVVLAAIDDGIVSALGIGELWSGEGGPREPTPIEPWPSLPGVAVTYDGRMAISVATGGVATVWTMSDRTRVASLSGHGAAATDIAAQDRTR